MEVPEHIINILTSKDALHDRVFHYVGKGCSQLSAYEKTEEEVQQYIPEYKPYSDAKSYLTARNKAERKRRKEKFGNKVD